MTISTPNTALDQSDTTVKNNGWLLHLFVLLSTFKIEQALSLIQSIIATSLSYRQAHQCSEVHENHVKMT